MEIYNLYFGKIKPRQPFDKVKIGPFEISVKNNYKIIVNQLPRPNVISGQPDGDQEYIKGRIGGWIATADCRCENGSEKSILAINPIDDSGIWDLCQILTFLNGRNITCNPNDSRYDPNVFGDRACIDIEILHAAKVMWNNRKILVERKLVYSFLLYNSAVSCHDVNSRAGVISASFNGVYDDWLRQAKRDLKDSDDESKGLYAKLVDLTKEEKSIAKDVVQKAIESNEKIDGPKKDGLINLLKAKIDGGLLSPVNLIQAMLISEEIIPEHPDSSVIDRIKFMNTVRNKFVHNGAPPEFKKNPELSIEFSIFIICRLMPDLIQMYLGKAVGFTNKSVGSLSQHKHNFINYFNYGIYNGRKVESESYEDEISSIIQKANEDSK